MMHFIFMCIANTVCLYFLGLVVIAIIISYKEIVEVLFSLFMLFCIGYIIHKVGLGIF